MVNYSKVKVLELKQDLVDIGLSKETIDSLNDHFDYLQIGYKGKLKDVFARRRIIINDFEKYQEKGLEIKEKEDGEHKIELVNFAGFKKKGYKIFDYQKPSIALMNEIPNTANFSIPGAGKLASILTRPG